MTHKSQARARLALVRALLCVVGAISTGACGLVDKMAAEGLASGPNGPRTPADVGLAFEHIAIPSNGKKLDGYLVHADQSCENAPVILIYHGVRETISDWVGAQLFLHDRCVSSLVFDYAGSGDTPGPARYDDINVDAVSAYEFASASLRVDGCLVLLGHSMGNGHMLQAAARLERRPDGIVVANAFASMRATMSRVKGYGAFAWAIPDWWNNVEAVRVVAAPLLFVHSADDAVNPIADAEHIYAAAKPPKRFARLRGFDHNALHQNPSIEWWAPVLNFLAETCRG